MKRNRPWDKPRSLLLPHRSISSLGASTTTSTTTAKTTPNENDDDEDISTGNDYDAKTSVPYVTIQNQKYYSDRFYINKTIHDNDDITSKNNSDNCSNGTATNIEPNCMDNYCTICGGRTKDETKQEHTSSFFDKSNRINQSNDTCYTNPSSSLLFDRSAFIQSYFNPSSNQQNNLKAIIFGTYTLDDSTFMNEFPNLCTVSSASSSCDNDEDASTIPCLIVYGKRITYDSTHHGKVNNKTSMLSENTIKISSSSNSNTDVTHRTASISRSTNDDKMHDLNVSVNHKIRILNNNTNDHNITNDNNIENDIRHRDDSSIHSSSSTITVLETQDEMMYDYIENNVIIPSIEIETSLPIGADFVSNTSKIHCNKNHETATKTSSSSSPLQRRSSSIPNAENRTTFPTRNIHLSQINTTSSYYYKNWNDLLSSSSISFNDIIDPNTGYINSKFFDKNGVGGNSNGGNNDTGTGVGVHHSKYIIVFEKDGSIVICITTANLTTPTTTDATWIQRFFPIKDKHKNAVMNKSNNYNDDFGRTLANYLQCTILSTATNNVTAHWFVQQYLGWKSIRNIERNYDYSVAQVQLITVVPGEHKQQLQNGICDDNCDDRNDKKNCVALNAIKSTFRATSSTNEENTNKHPFLLYGQERISYIVQQLESSMIFKYRNMLYTPSDQLFIQPTSLGSSWNICNMSRLVRCYLGARINHNNDHNSRRCNISMNDQEAMQRLDIIWPTEKFVNYVLQEQQKYFTRKHNTQDTDAKDILQPIKSITKDVNGKNDSEPIPTEAKNGGYLFLSSESFNKIDLQCLNRMIMFEPSTSSVQTAIPHIPHFKSVTRLIGNRNMILQQYGNRLPSCEEYFSWFLLSSACLSRGAQGEHVQQKNVSDGTDRTIIKYTNFEIGVLFGSKISGQSNDRIYCFSPSECTCRTTTTTGTSTAKKQEQQQSLPRMIHLPVPYRYRACRYVDDVDDISFGETPYFHEILPGTGCEGNMLLTPFGKDLAKQVNL